MSHTSHSTENGRTEEAAAELSRQYSGQVSNPDVRMGYPHLQFFAQHQLRSVDYQLPEYQQPNLHYYSPSGSFPAPMPQMQFPSYMSQSNPQHQQQDYRGAVHGMSYADASRSESSDHTVLNAPGRGVPNQEPIHLPTPDADSIQLPEHLTKVEEEKLASEVNPDKFEEPKRGSRFFVIKSYSEEDVHKAIKYSVWSSSKTNNETLNKAFKSLPEDGSASSAASTPNSTSDMESKSPAFLKEPMVYLLFSVNGSGHFCGVARLNSEYRPNLNAGVWCQDKWTGLFYIRWLYVKDVPNPHLRHIRLANNENKPVTNTRDGFEVEFDNGVKVLKVIHHFKYTTTLFDDYDHYDRLEKEKHSRKGRN